MKKNKPLHISIPEPCQQNWNNMSASDGGHYCSQCSKTVLDFSSMTDAELIQHFKTRPVNVCGRFRPGQLERDILPTSPRRLLPALYQKIAAAVLAMLSFRFSTAQVQKKNAVPSITQSAINRSTSLPDSAILTGKVTQNYAQPVANAKVSFDGLIETYTNAEGKFRIQLSRDMMGSHNLYFNAAGLKRAVRNFNPVMGSAEYTVNLDSPDECDYSKYIMGGIRSDPELHDFPSISFATSETVLSPDDKLLLATVAEHMRMEPQIVIKLVAYGKGLAGTRRATQKNKLIRDYLVKSIGISEARIKQQVEKISGVKLVDVLQQAE